MDFDADTIKHATTSKIVIGLNSILSPALFEVKLPIVFSTRKAVTIHERILIVVVGGLLGNNPARRQIT